MDSVILLWLLLHARVIRYWLLLLLLQWLLWWIKTCWVTPENWRRRVGTRENGRRRVGTRDLRVYNGLRVTTCGLWRVLGSWLHCY